MLKLILIAIVFILGLYFTCNYTSQNIIEGFDVSKNSCPNILIQKGKELYLHNSRRAKIPGVNPVKFNNLEEYVEFLDWQRSQNIKCPVLCLQHSFYRGANLYDLCTIKIVKYDNKIIHIEIQFLFLKKIFKMFCYFIALLPSSLEIGFRNTFWKLSRRKNPWTFCFVFCCCNNQ